MARNRESTGTAHKSYPLTHYDARLMRIASVRLGTLSGRVTVEESILCSILELDTEDTVRGGSAMSRRMHGGEVLARSSCARHARVIRLGCFYCGLRLGGFDYETRCRGSMTKHRRRGKKRRSTP